MNYKFIHLFHCMNKGGTNHSVKIHTSIRNSYFFPKKYEFQNYPMGCLELQFHGNFLNFFQVMERLRNLLNSGVSLGELFATSTELRTTPKSTIDLSTGNFTQEAIFLYQTTIQLHI